MLLEELPWDSRFFGFPIAKVTKNRLSSEEFEAIDHFCEVRDVICVYLLADHDHKDTHKLAFEHGFKHVGDRLELALDCKHQAQSSAINLTINPVRDCLQEDLVSLKDIAATAHRESRFYIDQSFSEEQCNRLYVQWIENNLNSESVRVFVTEHEGSPAGYLSVSNEKTGEALIELFAVNPKVRRQGLGGSLLYHAIKHIQIGGQKTIRVVTQNENEVAKKTYGKHGFKTVSIRTWYHKWMQIPPKQK